MIAVGAIAYNYQKEADPTADRRDFVQKPLQVTVIFNKIAEYRGVQDLDQEFPGFSQTVRGKEDFSQVESQLAARTPDWKSTPIEALLLLSAEEIYQIKAEMSLEQKELAIYLKFYNEFSSYSEQRKKINDLF